MAQAPARNFITAIEDSRRWRNIVRRPGDIIISTPPKSGTTWMQGIVSSLLWPNGDAPGRRGTRSPWIDARTTPLADLVANVEAQDHRRYFKTHSPADCIPFDGLCHYIVVFRDGRDTLVSWGNHRATMRQSVVDAINTVAGQSKVTPLAPQWQGDYDELFAEWLELCSAPAHLASWWSRRHDTNVLFVHFADLLQDLSGEMTRIAGFLDLDIDETLWPAVVDRCRIDEMRAHARTNEQLEGPFEGGADAFFHKGTNGRWRDVLTDEQIDRYLAHVAAVLPTDASSWLEHGSLCLGVRPHQIGQADDTVLDTGVWHPIFSRLAKRRPVNSIDAITERRVEEARDAGLFDDLALHGRPIPDIDRQRQPGWWANQFVAKERNKVTALQLEDELRTAMPALWRLTDEPAVTRRVEQLNDMVDAYNRVTTLQPMTRLEIDEVLATWRRLQSRP